MLGNAYNKGESVLKMRHLTHIITGLIGHKL
jgi:hypothetical protein